MPAAAVTLGGEGDGSSGWLAHQPISLAGSRKSLRPRARKDCHRGSMGASISCSKSLRLMLLGSISPSPSQSASPARAMAQRSLGQTPAENIRALCARPHQGRLSAVRAMHPDQRSCGSSGSRCHGSCLQGHSAPRRVNFDQDLMRSAAAQAARRTARRAVHRRPQAGPREAAGSPRSWSLHRGSRPACQGFSRVRGRRRNLNPASHGLRGVRACAVGTRPETTRAGPVAQLTRVNATFMATGGRQDACAWGKSCSRSSM